MTISELSILAAIFVSLLTYLNQARNDREKDKREDLQVESAASSNARSTEASAAKQITDASASAVDAYKNLYEEMKVQLNISRQECKDEIAALQKQVQENSQQLDNLLKENERIRRAQDQLLHYNESLEAQVSSMETQVRFYKAAELKSQPGSAVSSAPG